MNFNNKKIAILGFGIEGRSVYEYLQQKDVKDITIIDVNPDVQGLPEGVKTIFDKDAIRNLQDYDIVFRSPTVTPYKINTNGKVWSATNEFFAECPAPIIGVTGTKGKGTTASLVSKILENAGMKVHLVGNIGIPALGELSEISKDDIVVFEMSSFQLWDIEYSPHVAVVLMVEPDHLDIHADIDEYIEAKSNIVKFQKSNDIVIRHPNNEMTSQVVLPAKSEKISYMTKGSGAYIENDHVMINGQPVIATSDVGLLGGHNLENVCAAVTAAWQHTEDVSAAQKAIKDFKGLPHRLQFYKEINAVKYYDDSFAASPSAAVVASKAFSKPVVQIVGGHDRDLDYSKFTQLGNNAKHIVLIGKNKVKIIAEFEKAGVKNFSTAESMKEAVSLATKQAEQGEIVVLSPGSPSFDWYNNYKERADDFRREVDELQP